LKTSRYFSDLIKNYTAEIDDLLTDSDGKTVLQKRLNDKRREIDAILPMIAFSPEMVAVVFYNAFSFNSSEIMQRAVLSEPGRSGFPAWSVLAKSLTTSVWADPLIVSTLKAQGGDAFLVATAALEYLRTRGSIDEPAPEQDAKQERGDEDEEDGENDLAEAGADWLAEQGFEPLAR
jgi:hypothetical protein